jgi:integrase
MARQIFRRAVRLSLIARNPFDGVVAGSEQNRERSHFVTRQDTQRVLEVCPDLEWRLLVALTRYGGLRMPSEVLGLTWDDIL